jgi:DNA polymerase-3 subunit epsilon
MRILGLDLETTGLDPQTCEIIEVGAVLWDTNTRQPVQMLMGYVSGPEVSPEISELTGLTTQFLREYGQPRDIILSQLLDLIASADAICAHNAPFDRAFLEAAVTVPPINWIDTKLDIPYPPRKGAGSLTTIAAVHGFLNPFPHRAVFDVLTMLKVMDQYSLEEILTRAASPTFKVVSYAPFEQKDTVKQAGFYWDAGAREWSRNMKQCDYDPAIFPFRTGIRA